MVEIQVKHLGNFIVGRHVIVNYPITIGGKK